MKTEAQKQAEKQIYRLDRKLGEGVGAVKERKRLAQKLGLLMCGHHYDLARHPYLAISCLEREDEEFRYEREDQEFERPNEPDDY